MSLDIATNLLRQYNKYGQKQETIKTEAADVDNRSPKVATRSYANMYDALYDKYSKNKNFNLNMWRDAIAVGEQDQYLAFLDKNKDVTLSNEFYDPSYYNYEQMMLELYLPFADTENKEERFDDVYDNITGKWVQQSIGEMSEYEFIKHQLDISKNIRSAELEKQYEQMSKDRMSDWERFGNNVKATLYEFGEGLLSGLTGLVDLFGGLGYATYKGIAEGDNWGDAFVEYFGEKGLLANEKRTIRASLDEWERKYTSFKDIDGNSTGWGKYLGGVANSIGMMAPSIVAATLTGGASIAPWVSSVAGSGTFYASIFSNNMYENATNYRLANTPSSLLITNAAVKTGVEAVIEYGLGKMFGVTAGDMLRGVKGGVSKAVVKNITWKTGLAYLGKSALQEGVEEVLQDFTTHLVDEFMSSLEEGEGFHDPNWNIQTLIDSFVTGSLSSLVMSGGHITISASKSAIINAHAKHLDAKDTKALRKTGKTTDGKTAESFVPRYDKKLKVGPGDLVIETEKGLKKMRGANRLYFGQVLSTFKSAVDELRRGKISATKNIGLAQEVYGALTALTDLYSTFSDTRIKNCERLLARVANASDAAFAERYERAASILSPETVSQIVEHDKTVKKEVKSPTRKIAKERARSLADSIEATFREMVYGAPLRVAAKVRAAVEKEEEKLKAAGVTKMTGAVNKKGKKFKADQAVKDLGEHLGKEAESTLDKLMKEYEWVFTTDGHIAYESDDILFVSESWLKNYTSSEIYQFLAQTKIIDALLTVPKYKEFINMVYVHYRQFSKQTDATMDEAVMNFLFNDTVYQHFLLSQNGKNLHTFTDFIFRFGEMMKNIVTKRTGLTAEHLAMFEKVYDKIKETWRKPTLKAILNWNMTPQEVGADNILTDADLKFVDQYGKHKQSLLGPKAGASKSAYQNLKEDIIAHTYKGFNNVELELIERGTRDDASPRDALSAFALLDYADDYMSTTSGSERVLAPLRELIAETEIVLSNNRLASLEVEKLIEDMNWYVDRAIIDEPGWTDSRNNYNEEDVVARTVDEIEALFSTYRDVLTFNINDMDRDDYKRLDKGVAEIVDLIEALHGVNSLTELKTEVERLADKLRANASAIFDGDKIGKYDQDTVFDTLYDYLHNTFDKIYELVDGSHALEVQQRYILDNLRDAFYAADRQDKLTNAMLQDTTKDVLKILRIIASINSMRALQSKDLQHSFVILPETLGDENSMKPALIQHKADKLEEFRQVYGISALQLLYGDLRGLSLEQRNKINSEMQSLGITKYSTFVCRQLEAMLGPDWAVSERYSYYTYEQEARILSDARNMLQRNILRLHDLYYLQIASPIPKASKEIRDIANNILKIYDESKSLFNRLDANADQVVENETYNVKTTYGKALKNFRRLLTNINEALSHIDNEGRLLLDIISSESAIYEFMAVLSREQKKMESPHPEDFDIVRKVEARQLLSSSLFADTREQQNNNIINMFIGDITLKEYFAFYADKGDTIDPDTGEVLKHYEPDEFDAAFISKHPRILSATDFLKSKIDALKGVYIEIEQGEGGGGYDPITRCITLSIKTMPRGNLHPSIDLLDVLCHELNHAIQDYHTLHSGGNPTTTIKYEGLLEHVLNEYWEYVAYTINDTEVRDIIYNAKTNGNRILKLSDFPAGTSIRKDLAYCAYRLLQGELWAQYHSHNGRPVTGYKHIFLDNKSGFISPDGTTFLERDKSTLLGNAVDVKVQDGTAKSADMSLSSKHNLFVGTMRNILTARADTAAVGPYKTTFTHNNFHTSLNITGKSAEVCEDLLSPTVGILDKAINKLYTVNNIIAMPEFLNDDIQARLNGDYSEGNVYYRVKEYVEEKHPGVSIDRTAEKHQYILVSTDCFDDLVKPSLASKLSSKDATLQQKYEGRVVKLSEFYRKSELDKLGIPDINVVMDPTVATQAIFDKEHKQGEIHIQTSIAAMSDEVLLDKLNHEFRHVLQKYNKFELGFTRDFKVSAAMLADVKKHIPELFKDEALVESAKNYAKSSKENWEKEIVKSFVYYTTHGELEAYGFMASLLAAKPIYTAYEAGKPVIYMPWYDANTGEGRYRTDYIAARANDAEVVKLTVEQKEAQKKVAEMPKEKGGRINVSREAAKGTNLEFFTNKLGPGEQLQMDVGLYDFIVATTDNLDKLPPELAEAIEKAILNKDALFRWFRKGKENVDKLFNKPTKSDPRYDEKLAKFIKNVETYNKQYDYAFKLMNKYIFKNDYLTSENELSEFVNKDISQLWAAIRVARKHGLSEETLENKHGISGKKIQMLIDAMQTEEYVNDFKAELRRWDRQAFDKKNGTGQVYKKVEYDEILPFVRTTAMLNFNGTLASAYAVGDIIRRDGKIYHEKEGTLSYNATMSDKEGNAAEYGDNLSDANKLTETENDSLGNDILAIYLRTHKELTQDEMIDQLVPRYREHLIDKALKVILQKFKQVKNKGAVRELLSMTPDDFNRRFTTLENKEDLTDKELSRYKQLTIIKPYFEQIYQTLFDWVEKLRNSSLENVLAYYDKVMTREANSIPQTDNTFKVPDKYAKFETAEQIRKAIQYRGRMIAGWVIEKKLSFNDLPDDIKDMFEYKVFEGEKRKQYKIFALKRSTYEVGTGKVALDKKMDGKGFSYTPEYDIEKDVGKFRHDTAEAKRNLVKIAQFYEAQSKVFDEQKQRKKQEERDLNVQLKRYKRDAEKKQNEINIAVKRAVAQSNKKGDLKQTEMTVKKRRDRLSDTPNYFTIVAGKEMPQKLYKIFDTSFTEMRNTAVQFVSKDENGEYYDRSKEKNFDSLVKHEAANWDDFYEANRAELLELTREDVLDFLEFFQSGMVTVDGPANKLEAFKVFILGYIVDGARRNFNNWNFSDKEIATLEKLYESIASKAGSTLRAVGSMIKVVDPLKKIRQYMFDDWMGVSDADKIDLFKAIDAMQTEKDKEKRNEKTQAVINIAERLLKQQEDYLDEHRAKRFSKEWWSRWYSRTKSLRYTSMLSSPMTWIRNQVSNVGLTATNALADLSARLIDKKAYRKDQWDITHTKIRDDVAAFIKEEFLDNPLFDKETGLDLYNMSNKYDNSARHNTKGNKSVFVDIIVKAYERKFAAEHRFNWATSNWYGKVVDKMLSDQKFIKFVAGRYFGKILTIELEKGNVKLEMNDDVLNLFAEAVIQANRDYMHKRNAVTDMIDSIRDTAPPLHEFLVLWQPFLNSSLNWWIDQVYKLSPIGLGHAIYRMCTLEKQITKADELRAKGRLTSDSRFTEYLIRRDIGKGLLGTFFTTLAFIAVFSGLIKIEEEDDKLFICAADNVRVDVSSLYGSSTFLIGASIAQSMLDGEKSIYDTLGTASIQMTNGFFLNDILERHKWNNPMESVVYELDSFARSFVPQFWQLLISLLNFNNTKIKYSSGFKGALERWLNSWVLLQPAGEIKVDPYTGKARTKYALPVVGPALDKGLAFGIKIFWYDVSEQEKLALEYGIKKGELTGELTVNRKKVDIDRIQLNQVYGMLNEKSLTKIKSQSHKVEMPDGTYKTLAWDKLSDEQRVRVIDRTMETNADIAKIYVWTQKLGHKYYASASMLKRLRLAGFTKNVYLGDKGFVE